MPRLTFEFIVEGVLLFIVGCVGVCANVIAMLVFLKKRNVCFFRLMISLCVYDMIYLIASLIMFSWPLLFPQFILDLSFATSITYLLPIAQIAMTGSIYTMMAISVERYITVCHPFFKLSHNWPASRYFLPILLFCISYNIPKFFELQVVKYKAPDSSSRLNYFVMPTDLRMNQTYIYGYIMWSNLIFNGVTPLLALLFLNISVYRKLKRQQVEDRHLATRITTRDTEVKLSQVSLVIVIVFIFCHSVKWVPNIWEMRQAGLEEKEVEWPVWVEYITYTSHLLTTVNGSVNVFIYFLKHGSCLRRSPRHQSGLTVISTDIYHHNYNYDYNFPETAL